MKELFVSLVISHGASQKAMLSLPFPYLREPFLWSAKIILSFRAFVGHVCYGSGWQRCLCGLSQAEELLHYYMGSSETFYSLFFLREIFALNSLIFSGRGSALYRRRLECEIISSLLC